jgi:hypothetical protein
LSSIAGMPAMLLGEPGWWHATDAPVVLTPTEN